MAGYKKYNNDGPSAEDKALDLFAEMMIERIETISKDWSKPWITEGSLGWPKNLSGREYNGMNALMLLLHCEKNGYKYKAEFRPILVVVFPFGLGSPVCVGYGFVSEFIGNGEVLPKGGYRLVTVQLCYVPSWDGDLKCFHNRYCLWFS